MCTATSMYHSLADAHYNARARLFCVGCPAAMGVGAAYARLGLLLTPLVAQYLIHISLPLALGVYSAACVLCVVCLRLLPIETVGRQMPSSMDELTRFLHSSSGGGFANDARAHPVWRAVRWKATVDGFEVTKKSRQNMGGVATAADKSGLDAAESEGNGTASAPAAAIGREAQQPQQQQGDKASMLSNAAP